MAAVRNIVIMYVNDDCILAFTPCQKSNSFLCAFNFRKMARRKSRLSNQKPKHPYKKKNIYFLTTNTININEHFKVQKRKHVNTPLSTPRKSPFKSPLYTTSPAHKTKKHTTSRTRFQDNNMTNV